MVAVFSESIPLQGSVWFDQSVITREDVLKVAVLSFCLHYFRLLAKRNILSTVGAQFGITRQQGMDKFCENLWYCMYYLFTVSLAFTVFQGRPWFFLKHEHYFTDFPASHECVEFPAIRWFYLLQFSFYLQSALAMVLWDTRRKDLWQMVIHHAVTIFGMAFAFMAAEHRVGVTSLVVHDMADIFLSFSKVVNYVDLYGSPKRKWTFHLKNVGFGLFTLVWILTRNLAYPLLVIWPSMLHAPAEGDFYKHIPSLTAYFTFNSKVLCVGTHCVDPHSLLIGFMCILETLHILWLYLIVCMITRSLSHGVQGDIRSDDEEHNDLTSKTEASESSNQQCQAKSGKEE